mmetsp:Transcript_25527/g.56766  ORF Transcript_25527/g.56766 Transcript_25527/m.56766 type:complete len:232 (-) Transcript_25527:740-1435(-)
MFSCRPSKRTKKRRSLRKMMTTMKVPPERRRSCKKERLDGREKMIFTSLSLVPLSNWKESLQRPMAPWRMMLLTVVALTWDLRRRMGPTIPMTKYCPSLMRLIKRCRVRRRRPPSLQPQRFPHLLEIWPLRSRKRGRSRRWIRLSVPIDHLRYRWHATSTVMKQRTRRHQNVSPPMPRKKRLRNLQRKVIWSFPLPTGALISLQHVTVHRMSLKLHLSCTRAVPKRRTPRI